MSENNPEAEGITEETAPDGLMASVALEDDKALEEGETIEHRADEEVEGEPTEEETFERPEFIPEKFWDDKEGPDLEKMMKSYDELQKQFSQGKHKAPKEYNTEVLTEAGYESNDPVVSTYLDWAQKYGVNQAAFDELASSITGMAGEDMAAVQLDLKQEREALGPNADEILKSNINWADGLERKGIISDAERAELNIWGGSAVGQRLMQKVRSMTGDMSKIPVADVAEAGVSEDDFKRSMQSKMNDSRYGNDPAFTRQVEKEFEQRYG
jgi:hypothetical protein